MKKDMVELPKRTVIVSGKYVYYTESVNYVKELKVSRPKRISIGKLSDTGLLIPNDNYYKIFGVNDDLIEPFNKSDSLSIGPNILIETISEKYGLKEILSNIFDDYDKILDLATFMIMTEDNKMQHFENYCYNHSLLSPSSFSDSTISKLFRDIKPKDIDLFMKSWVNVIPKDDIYIAYDSTNINTYGEGIDLAEYGHAKDNDELPQVNVSLGYNQTELVPMFYDIYPGSIIDNSECTKMVDRANSYGCKNVGFILDRGYFSLANVRYFEEHNYEYIIMAKTNAAFIKEVKNEYGPYVKKGLDSFIKGHDIYGLTYKKKLFNTDKTQYVHLYYDPQRASSEAIKLQHKFQRYTESLEEMKAKKIKRKEDLVSFEKYFNLNFDNYGYFLNYSRKDSKFIEELNNVGFFVIITSKEMTATTALEKYRDRDAVEKVFKMEKSYLGYDVFRVHSDEALEGKMFVSFIALILRNEIYKNSKELYLKNKKEGTVPAVLNVINKLTLTRMSDDKYHCRYKLTSKQKKIFKAMNIDENHYYDRALEIAKNESNLK